MRKKTEDKLLQLGITPNLKGFSCICEAVEILSKESDIKTTALYEIVGKRFEITGSMAERRIRHAISKALLFELEKNGFSGTKNSEFLYTLTLIVKREAQE